MTLTINDSKKIIPQAWNDMSLKQIIAAYQVIMHPFSALLPDGEEMIFKRIELMKILTGFTNDFLNRWKEDCLREDPDEGDLLFQAELEEVSRSVTDFMFKKIEPEKEGDPVRYQLNLGLTKCPWPVIEEYHGRKPFFSGKTLKALWKRFFFPKKNQVSIENYYAPADGLENITIYEMGMAFMAFERFMLQQNEDFAHELIAILYRPPKPPTEENLWSDYQGDIRLPYLHHESTVKKRKERMAKLPEPVKQLIVFWFASCRDLIISSFENVFTKPKQGSLGGNDYAWAGLILQLADGIVHVDQVAQQPWSTALTYISMLEDRRKEMEMKAALDKARNAKPSVL